MRAAPVCAVGLVATVLLAACATVPRSHAGTAPAGETITVAIGPCFGFCPVYSTTIRPDGFVRFDGQRHTAVLGERTRNVDEARYRGVARDLATFRPASGTEAVVDCSAAVSDTSPYTVTWTDVAGRNTLATVQGGCPDGPGRVLVERLRNLPERLGIVEWTKQTTRAGASKG